MDANISFNWAVGSEITKQDFFLLQLFLMKYFLITQVLFSVGYSLITFVKIMWGEGEVFEAQWKNSV